MVLGELCLRGEAGSAVGQGWDTGLAGLATDYGITVADQAVAEGRASVPPSVQRCRSAARTWKKRATAPTLAPLTFAVDPSWQPARVFSVTGVGNAEEQKRRATSTLLSPMMAVRDFGRALVARFGGPETP